jgi:nicotinamidase-related amidase
MAWRALPWAIVIAVPSVIGVTGPTADATWVATAKEAGVVAVESFLRSPRSTALLVVDMQNDFLVADAPVRVPGGTELVPLIAELAAQCRSAGFPVFYTQEMHRADLSDFGIELDFEPAHCLEGSGGEELIDGLGVMPSDVLIRGKRRYNAFLGTDLDLALRIRGVENLIVTGVCTDVCVIATVHHARNLDYRCFVLEDLVAGTTVERHLAALECMSNAFALVGSSADVLPAFGLRSAAAATPLATATTTAPHG